MIIETIAPPKPMTYEKALFDLAALGSSPACAMEAFEALGANTQERFGKVAKIFQTVLGTIIPAGNTHVQYSADGYIYTVTVRKDQYGTITECGAESSLSYTQTIYNGSIIDLDKLQADVVTNSEETYIQTVSLSLDREKIAQTPDFFGTIAYMNRVLRETPKARELAA